MANKNLISHAQKGCVKSSEKYSRGRRGAPAKGVGRATGARVQIPLSPLQENDLNIKGLSRFFVKTTWQDFLKIKKLKKIEKSC